MLALPPDAPDHLDGGPVSGLDDATARWLTSPAGLAAVAQATAALDGGEDTLQLSARLARDVADAQRRAAALSAAVCRRSARARWAEADDLLFTREALEQASDPAVSAHRADALLARAVGEGGGFEGTVLDLGAGVGGDAMALARAAARVGARVVAVDTDPARLRLLAHNAEVAGVTITTRCADGLEVTSGPGVVCHADPGRRVGGRRVRRLREHRPSVPALLAAHADALHLAVALSPGVEPEDPDLPPGLEVEYVQLGTALVEATVWTGAGAGAAAGAGAGPHPALRRATLLGADGTEVARLPQGGREELAVGEVGAWLIEVAPAAVRARQHDALGAAIGARRVARTRALLTCDAAVPVSPWYRAWPVLAVLPARPKAVRRWLTGPEAAPHLDGGVEIVLHGVEAEMPRLWQQLGRPVRGPSGLRVAFIRRDDDAVAVVTRASPSDAPDPPDAGTDPPEAGTDAH